MILDGFDITLGIAIAFCLMVAIYNLGAYIALRRMAHKIEELEVANG